MMTEQITVNKVVVLLFVFDSLLSSVCVSVLSVGIPADIMCF